MILSKKIVISDLYQILLNFNKLLYTEVGCN